MKIALPVLYKLHPVFVFGTRLYQLTVPSIIWQCNGQYVTKWCILFIALEANLFSMKHAKLKTKIKNKNKNKKKNKTKTKTREKKKWNNVKNILSSVRGMLEILIHDVGIIQFLRSLKACNSTRDCNMTLTSRGEVTMITEYLNIVTQCTLTGGQYSSTFTLGNIWNMIHSEYLWRSKLIKH